MDHAKHKSKSKRSNRKTAQKKTIVPKVKPVALVADSLALAIEFHNSGQLSKAENLYQQILEHDSNHVDALHLHAEDNRNHCRRERYIVDRRR